VPDGVLVIDKPAGMTSHDVVDAVRKRLHTKKVGHAGTLDPDATGVLIVGVGRATRLLSYAQGEPKRYTAVALFGVSTSTQDASGEIVGTAAASLIDQSSVERELATFVGEIDQVPPMVSAVKVGGERLYKKARRGEEVERKARRVTIHEARVLTFEGTGDHPLATIDVRCSSGTYVRTLVHDLGAALGCGAHLLSLRRTESGGHTLADAVEVDAVELDVLQPVEKAVAGLPRLEIGETDARFVRDGRALTEANIEIVPDGEATAIISGGELIAVYRRQGERLVAERVLAQQAAP
jgi:tRNA pseudouridine55 synthase